VVSVLEEEKFGQSRIFDVREIADGIEEPWVNESLVEVNDTIVRMGIFEGEFHWHSHTEEDELFFVLEGRMLLDLPEESLELGPWQGYTVPRGVRHRTRAPERTVVLMVEKTGVKPAGD
jgi:mannose-6-phosphate isomerase-like protein (cupin superfamily)